MAKYSLAKQVINNQNVRKKTQEYIELSINNLQKIKKDSRTKVIKFPEYSEAFNYIEKLFPSSNIKEISIYKTSPILLEKIGYKGVGGFFNTLSKDVVISSYLTSGKKFLGIKFKAETDEIMVHELLHYCFDISGMVAISKYAQEEFAYGWSWGYMKNKGLSEDYVIKHNFIPFLVSLFYEKATAWVLGNNNLSLKDYNSFTGKKKIQFMSKYKKNIEGKSFEYAYELGKNIISMYEEKMKNGIIYGNNFKSNEKNSGLLLDLDD
jgi:hypothetical protein